MMSRAFYHVRGPDLDENPVAGPSLNLAMHEFSIMESALEQILDQAQLAGAAKVYAIRLRIGALSGVVPDALQFAFEGLSPGTIAEGARLDLDVIPARFWCATCQQEFQADNMFAECPVCATPSRHLRSGRELEVGSMEIE